MDTISRENNTTSYLPFAGLIAGVIALILAVVGLVQVSKMKAANQAFQEEQTTKISTIEATANAASSAASTASESASRGISGLQRSTQDAFGQVAGEITRINGEIVKLQESATKPKLSAKDPKEPKTPAGPAVAGPDEYVIAGGDTGAKIARAKAVSLADLIAVNPGVSWTGLKVGQKIKIPKK
jgi:LysM repeat protein